MGGGGEEEKSTAMPLDQFEPDAFGAVLDYMYGGELRLSVEVGLINYAVISIYFLFR